MVIAHYHNKLYLKTYQIIGVNTILLGKLDESEVVAVEDKSAM